MIGRRCRNHSVKGLREYLKWLSSNNPSCDDELVGAVQPPDEERRRPRYAKGNASLVFPVHFVAAIAPEALIELRYVKPDCPGVSQPLALGQQLRISKEALVYLPKSPLPTCALGGNPRFKGC